MFYNGSLVVKVNGTRHYSRDLEQGGMELPGRYVFTSYESTLHSKLEQLVNGVMVDYHKKVQEMEAKNKKKKKSKKVEK